MTNPLLYDIKRTLTSKSVLILMAVMIAFGFAIIPSFTTTGIGTGSNFANTQVFTYYDSSGGYHFLGFAWNQFGQPVSGITFQANLSLSSPFFYGGPPQATTTSTSPVYQTQSVSTNSNGEAVFSVNAPLNSSYYVSILVGQPNGFGSCCAVSQPYQTFKPYNGTSTTGTPTPESIPAGQVVGVFGYGGISTVTDVSNSSQMDVQAIWVGPNGTLPTNYAVYYEFQNISNSYPQQCLGGTACTVSISVPIPVPTNTFNESNMHLLGTMSAYNEVFPPPKLEANLTANAAVILALFYPNGTMATQPDYVNTQQLYPPPPPPITPGQGTAFVLSFFQVLFGIFIPLLAIVGSFNSYGKDRVSGVLESVLAQPVSRRGLSISRFLSSFAATAIAVSISIAVVDSIAFYFSKSFVSSTIILSSAGAFFVELAAFIGIMMLLSHIVKSSGALIGIGIGLFIVIDFFWGIITGILANISNTPYGSTGYYQLLIFAQFVNPAQFVSLVDTYLTHQASFVGLSFFNLAITPEAYGITIPAIIVTGILWIAVPLAVFMYLAVRRD